MTCELGMFPSMGLVFTLLFFFAWGYTLMMESGWRSWVGIVLVGIVIVIFGNAGDVCLMLGGVPSV